MIKKHKKINMKQKKLFLKKNTATPCKQTHPKRLFGIVLQIALSKFQKFLFA